MQPAELGPYDHLTILVVDDHPMIRALLVRLLLGLGFVEERILQAGDGVTAFHLLNVHRIDAVLSDVDMGTMGGLDLLKELRMGFPRATPATIPFVFVSGSAGDLEFECAAQLDADGFIVKPPRASELEQVLAEVFLRPRPQVDALRYAQVATGTEYDRAGRSWYGINGFDLAQDPSS